MRPFIVVIGILLLVVGAIPIILGANETLVLNDCTSGGRLCIVRTDSGACAQTICTIDPFYGQNSIEGIRGFAYSLIEIGAVVATVGAGIAVIGARARLISTTEKEVSQTQ
jgi:hypothetical protein